MGRRVTWSGQPAVRRRAVAAGLAVVALGAWLPWLVPAAAAARSVTATPGADLDDGNLVTVRWSGFRPGGMVTVTQCQAGAAAAERRGACLWGANQLASSDLSGSGEVSFRVWAGTLNNPIPVGQLEQALRYPDPNALSFVSPIRCDSGNPCEMAVTEDSLRLNAERSAASGTLAFSTPPAPDWPQARPAAPVAAPPTAAWPVRSPDAPLPAAGAEALELRGAGGNANIDVINRWLRNMNTGSHPVLADYRQRGSTDGNQQLVTGFENGFAADRPGVDFAITGLPFTPAELQRAGGPGKVAYAPVSLGSLALAYHFRYGHGPTWPLSGEIDETTGEAPTAVEPATVLPIRMTPTIVARAYGQAGTAGSVGGGSGFGWSHPLVTALNGRLPLPGGINDDMAVLVRRDPSAQTQLLFEWLYDRIGGEEYARLFPTAPVPSPDFPFRSFGATAVSAAGEMPAALDLSTDKMRIGYMETATFHKAQAGRAPFTQQHHNLGLAYIENAAGRLVQPSPEGVLAAADTADLRPDGSLKLDFADPDPRIYPLAQVHYMAVPTEGLDPAKRIGLARMIEYMVGDEGQRLAAEEGFVPLPARLRAQSLKVAARLRPAAAPTPTTTAAATATTDPGTTTTAPPAPDAAAGTTASKAEAGPAPAGRSDARPAAPRPGLSQQRRPGASAPAATAPTLPFENAAAASPEGNNARDDNPFGRGGIVPKAATVLGLAVVVAFGVAAVVGGGAVRWRLAGAPVPGWLRPVAARVRARVPWRRPPT